MQLRHFFLLGFVILTVWPFLRFFYHLTLKSEFGFCFGFITNLLCPKQNIFHFQFWILHEMCILAPELSISMFQMYRKIKCCTRATEEDRCFDLLFFFFLRSPSIFIPSFIFALYRAIIIIASPTPKMPSSKIRTGVCLCVNNHH